MRNLDFSDLQNNFNKRTYGFEEYQKQLGKSNPRLLSWIGSIDYSGYTREQCLKYLIANYQLGDENRILLRLEDWVEEIQKIALEWTKENFCNLSLKQINLNYKLILYLLRKRRLQNQEAIKIINSCLIEKSRNLEPKVFYGLNANFRKYLYLLTIHENQDMRSLLINDKDPINRLLLLQLFKFEQLSPIEKTALRQDKCSLVKRRFIYYQINQNIKPNKEEWIGFALDKNKGIREIAAYYLKHDYQIDAYQIYKQRTDDKFYYISDYSRKDDISYFLAGLSSNNKQIKLSSLKAICTINAIYLKQFDLKKLILENGKLKRLIIPQLNSILSLSELEDHKEALLSTSKGALIYLHLLYKKSYWHFIDYAVDLLHQKPNEENINFIWKLYYQKTDYYQPIKPKFKTKLISKINKIKNSQNHKIQKICKDFEFILK